MKTPTAAAAYLIDHLASTLMRVENAQAAIIDGVKKALEVEKMRIQYIGSHTSSVVLCGSYKAGCLA